MTEIIQYDNPNDITYMDTLKIQTVSRNLSPKIYANGRNQLPIEITVKVSDKNNKVLKFSKDTWIHILNLCFAESDKKLSLKGNRGWCFTDVENDYSKEIQVGSLRSNTTTKADDGTVIIIMYVYSDDIDTKRIAVSVDTDNGKHFTTADNASGAEKMSVTVKSVQKIDYSLQENIKIIPGDFEDISSTLGWTSRWGGEDGIYDTHYDGTCKRKFVKIHPAAVEQDKFKKHEINYNIVTNGNVNTDSICWKGMDTENCFTLIQGPGYPCAVIGRGASYNDYQINCWYSINNRIHIDGHVYLESPSYYYRFCPYVDEDHTNDKDNGLPTLLLYKFTMPDDGDHQYGWSDVKNSVTVNVTDYYGNQGMFQLTFNDRENFDIPGIV